LYLKKLTSLQIKLAIRLPWRRGLVVSTPPATEETAAMGWEIEYR
jgi:hypothetical protein